MVSQLPASRVYESIWSANRVLTGDTGMMHKGSGQDEFKLGRCVSELIYGNATKLLLLVLLSMLLFVLSLLPLLVLLLLLFLLRLLFVVQLLIAKLTTKPAASKPDFRVWVRLGWTGDRRV